jgi:riboflavin synthase alpha subunit
MLKTIYAVMTNIAKIVSDFMNHGISWTIFKMELSGIKLPLINFSNNPTIVKNKQLKNDIQLANDVCKRL